MNKSEFIIWEGIYSNYDEAQNTLTGSGFGSQRYIDQCKVVMEESLECLQKNEVIPLFHKQRFTLLSSTLALLKRFTKHKYPIKLTDFGGGFGMGYLNCLEEMQQLQLKYSIVELPEVCLAASSFSKLHKLDLSFFDSIKAVKESDLIFCSSAFQYIKDWKALIKDFCNLQPKAILMSDVFCGNFNTFMTIQNYYESKIPHWFFNLREICDEFNANGYELASKSVSTGVRAGKVDFLPMDNFPELTFPLNFIFNEYGITLLTIGEKNDEDPKTAVHLRI
jgi:putative methyltransferase (TIGR04325 family)